MATYSRTYIYNVHVPAGGRQYRYADETVPFSSFLFHSGDSSHKVLKVLSVSATTRVFRPQGAPTGNSGFYLILSNGTNTYTSELATQRIGDSSWTGDIVSQFSSGNIPVLNWVSITQIQIKHYNDGSGGESGTGFNKYPLYLTITYSDSEYAPNIDSFDGYRWDNELAIADDQSTGMKYSYALSLGKEKVNISDGPSYLRLTYNDIVRTITEVADGESLSTLNTLIDETIRYGYIPDNTFDSGTNYNVYLEFCYCGEVATSVEVPLLRSFANVWESGSQSGGVAFGRFGSSTDNNPKFECAYPAYFESSLFAEPDEMELEVSSAFKAYESQGEGYQGIKLRTVGFMCELYGTVSPVNTISGSATHYTICTIPEGYRPSQQINQVCQGSTQYSWMLRIDTDGLVTFSRYHASSSYASAGTSAWLSFHATWMI